MERKIDCIDGLGYGVSITNSYNNNPTSMEGADNALMYAANVSYSTKIDNFSIKVA
ncbi:MAG: hypothetical protein ACLUKN_15980 [Bacilli bacterium]